MDGTTDYKLNVDSNSYESEAHVARSMSSDTAGKMVRVTHAAKGVTWTPEMSMEVACWTKKANKKNLHPPRAVRQVVGDLSVRRESTVISSMTPMLAEPRHFKRYVNMLKKRVPNWERHLDPFFDAYDELQEQLDTEREEQRRRDAAGGLDVDSESDPDGTDDDEQCRGGARRHHEDRYRGRRNRRAESSKDKGSDASRGGSRVRASRDSHGYESIEEATSPRRCRRSETHPDSGRRRLRYIP
jgi:hypothetical protein